MKWVKKGLIYNTTGEIEWSRSHAQVPKADVVDDATLRIYYGTRDEENRTRTSYIEVSTVDPKKILYVHKNYILKLGRIGSFDDCGIMPSCIVNYTSNKYLFYTGWNTDKKVPYRLAIGLAISKDGGEKFMKVSEGPIIDRCFYEPLSVSQPFVIFENGIWRMWYSSFTKWEEIKGRLEPYYNIKYAESKDGIKWKLTGITCIDYDEDSDALINPYVWIENDKYNMLYSYRKNVDYRLSKDFSYRIGYAISNDGLNWNKIDGLKGLEVSDKGWDSEMIAYPNIYEHSGKKYLLYNGNGFGRTGFGYALMKTS